MPARAGQALDGDLHDTQRYIAVALGPKTSAAAALVPEGRKVIYFEFAGIALTGHPARNLRLALVTGWVFILQPVSFPSAAGACLSG